jgi:Mg2+-importing ATPase
MGTVVRAGSGTGVVVATGGRAVFGRIALGLGEHQPETEFQVGLRKFSMLLVQVAAALTAAIFIINVVLHRPVIDALLFSLAIAVGISPQLLPAVVSTSLAAGAAQLARRKVLVKRLVCIEDLGDVLFTDKTGTLTEGRVSFMRSVGPDAQAAAEPLLLGMCWSAPSWPLTAPPSSMPILLGLTPSCTALDSASSRCQPEVVYSSGSSPSALARSRSSSTSRPAE